MSLVLRGPTGATKQCSHELTIGRGELGLPNSNRISRKHLQILRVGAEDGGGAALGRWEAWRTGSNAVRLMRPGLPSIDIGKASGVEIRAGYRLHLATMPGAPPDSANTLEVITESVNGASGRNDRQRDPLSFVPPRRKRARTLLAERQVDGLGGVADGSASSAASSLVDLTSPERQPRDGPSDEQSGESDDDVVVVRTVRGCRAAAASDGDDVVVVGESGHPRVSSGSAAASLMRVAAAGISTDAASTTQAEVVAISGGSAPASMAPARRGLTRKRAFDCPICMVDCEPDEGYTLACTHSFCAACVGQYTAIKVKDGEVSQKQLVCPSEDCKAPLTAFDVEGVLTHADNGAELWSKFDQFRLTRYVEQEETSHHCPGPGCTYMFFVTPADRNQKRFDCPQCSSSFCLRCKEKWHDGRCPVPEDESMSEYMKNTTLKQCPSCKNMVEKSEGCNAVQCRCGIQFCFLCGKQIQAAGQKMSAELCQGCDPYVIQHRNQPVLSAAQRYECPLRSQKYLAHLLIVESCVCCPPGSSATGHKRCRRR